MNFFIGIVVKSLYKDEDNKYKITIKHTNGEDTMEAITFFNYGSQSAPPVGSNVVCLQVNQSTIFALMCDNYENYIDNLQENEVVSGNLVNKTYIKYTSNGIEITSSGLQSINIQTSQSATIKSPTITLDGNVNITGNATITGTLTAPSASIGTITTSKGKVLAEQSTITDSQGGTCSKTP